MMAPDREDCICPICMCIFIEPVTMPCKHSLCMPCYKQTVEKANLCCPICRFRISVWARRASKMKSLVDQIKWDAIKKAFPEQVQNRLEGNESQDDVLDNSDNYETQQRRLKELSKPGEIRQEYEAAMQKFEEEAMVEEQASAALIKALQKEEEGEKEKLDRQKEELDKMDRQIAEGLQENLESDGDWIKSAEPETTMKITTPIVSNKVNSKKATIGIKKGKNKQMKQPVNRSQTLTTFFSPVPRGRGTTSSSSDLKYLNESGMINNDSCSSDFHQSFHTLFRDSFSQGSTPGASTSHDRSYSSCAVKVNHLNENSCQTLLGQTSPKSTVSSKLKKCTVEIGNTKQLILRPELKGKFVASLSDLSTSYIGRVETQNTFTTSCTKREETHAALCTESEEMHNAPTSILDKITCLLDDDAHTRSDYSTSHFQSIIKCNRTLPQQLPKNFATDPSHAMAEAEKSVANNKLNLSTSDHASTNSKFRSFKTANPDTGYEIIHPIHDQHLQASNTRNIHNVCNASSQNSHIVSTKASTKRNKCGRIAQDPNHRLHQTFPAAPVLEPKLNSGIGQRVPFIESSHGQVENMNEDSKHLISIAPTDKPATGQTGKDGFSDKLICDFPESVKNEMKENDNTENEKHESHNTEKGIMESNNYEKRKMVSNNFEKRKMKSKNFEKRKMKSNNCEMRKMKSNKYEKEEMESSNSEKGNMESFNSEMDRKKSYNTVNDLSEPDSSILSVISFENDTDTIVSCDDSDSDRSYHNNNSSVATSGEKCTNIPSRSVQNNADKFGSNSETNLSRINIICNVEKKNSNVKTGSNQCMDTRMSIRAVHHKDLVNSSSKVCKSKNINHRTRKSKNATASLLKGEHTASFVSIKRWCVNNNEKFDEESVLWLDDDVIDKTESHHIKNDNMIDDKSEDIVKKQKQMLKDRSGKRKVTSDIQSEAKKSRRDDHIQKSTSDSDAGVCDILCPEDFDHSVMSQEQKDHLLALNLQKMYSQLDKQKIAVDRFKGSKDQYHLRKNRK